MPARKNPRRPTSNDSAPARGRGAGPPHPAEAMNRSVEEALNLWVQYARETGNTITEFLRRFGEEQEKSYESWASGLAEASRPEARQTQVEAARQHLEEWNRQAEEIGARVREAFATSLKPQRELLELWTKPFLPPEATPIDQAREIVGLVQKLWSGLTVDMTQRMVEALQPDQGLEEFVRAQDEVTKQFTENFQKLTRIYFTSPAFVNAFGRTLNTSLDLQKTWRDSDEFFRRITGLPTRQEISELNHAVRELSEQVSRLNGKRPP